MMFEVTPDPFPHVILEGHFPGPLLEGVAAEFSHPSDPRWRAYGNAHEGKLEGPPEMWGLRTRDYFDAVEKMTPDLSASFGIPDLSMETIGGGHHLIPPGGHLDVHTDFNRSPDTGLYRRLNFLTFLNHDWNDPGGRLELWPDADGEPIVISPEFGRTVIFETSDCSWHGHPKPAQRWRLSIAAYFFSPDPPPGYSEDHSTVWR